MSLRGAFAATKQSPRHNRELEIRDWRSGIGELAAGGLLLDQFPVGCEFHFYFDLLEAAVIPDQAFAHKIDGAIAFIVQAEVVVQVHAPFDDLAAAIAFDMEGVIAFLWPGPTPAEEFFEEAHSRLLSL